METSNKIKENNTTVIALKRKIYLLSMVMLLISATAGVIIWNLLSNTSNSLDYITQRVLPVTMVAEKITATSVQLNAEVPDVLNSRDQTELSAKYANLIKFIEKQATFLKGLDNVSHNTNISNELLSLIEKATNKLAIVNDYMSNILWTRDLEHKTYIKLKEINNQFTLQITKLADDALFDVVINSKTTNQLDNTPLANKTNVVGDKYLGKELTTLNTLLEIKSEGILVIGILETVINSMNIDEIAPFQERFVATVTGLKEHVKTLLNYDLNKFKELESIITTLVALGDGKDNCFSLRIDELKATNNIATVAKELKPIGTKIEEVEKALLIDILKNIDALNGFKIQYNKIIFVFGCIFIFLIFTIVGCLYLMRKISIKIS